MKNKMTVTEFLDLWYDKELHNIQNLKDDLRSVVNGLLPTQGVYSAKDVIDSIHKKLEDQLK